MKGKAKKQSYEELRKIWDAKLARSGFKDIEQPDGRLKTWTCCEKTRIGWFGNRVHNVASFFPTKRIAIQEYYRLAGFFLHDHQFESKLERAVWELHLEGLGRKQIFAKLKPKRPSLRLGTIRRIVSKLISAMKNRYLGSSNAESHH